MKKIFAATLFLIGTLGFSQSLNKVSNAVSEQLRTTEQVLVWLTFSDKEDSKLLKAAPEQIISEKAIVRRAKIKKSIDETDLPISNKYISEIEKTGFIIKQKSKWFNSVSGYISIDQLNKIKTLPFIKNIDAVQVYKKRQVEESGNLLKPADTQADSVYGESFAQLTLSKIPDAHKNGFTGKGITIALMDAGFEYLTHPAFSNMNIIAKWDFVNNNGTVDDATLNNSDQGQGSHGTATLSLIGAYHKGNMVGPAYGADYILAKTENTFSESLTEEDNWIAALEWADSIGVDVTSTSLGYLDMDNPLTSHTWEDMNGQTARITLAADLAVDKGIVVFNSAGNEYDHPSHNTLGAPADGFKVIAVGATNVSGTRASFSSVGPTVDGRIKPDIMAAGSSVLHAADSNFYYRGGGTSYSCPIAAGVGALVLEAHPDYTPDQVYKALTTTASKAANPDKYYGYGIINAVSAINHVLDTGGTDNNVPQNFHVFQNYPNPFNPTTTLRYEMSADGNIQITLYNVLGSRISILENRFQSKGTHEYQLNASGLASGVYFVNFTSNNFNKSIKIVLNK